MLNRLCAILNHVNPSRRLTTSASRSSVPVVNDHKACCSIPPVVSDYKAKGHCIEYAGFKNVYITGPNSSDTAIVSVYDIFGFKPQTKLGADMLAAALGAKVYMPDFFEPHKPFPMDRFPPETDEDKKKLQKFFSGPADQNRALEGLVRVGKQLRKDGFKNLGTYGLCWGGKVSILSGSYDSPVFDAVATAHPAMLKADDADDLSVPLGLFISKDEPKDEYDNMVEKITQKPFAEKNMYKYYPTMFHGWAAARADLKDPENKRQFEDVYAKMHEFFANAFEGQAVRK